MTSTLSVWLPMLAGIGGMAVAFVIVCTAAWLRITDRTVPLWCAPLAAFGFGLGASLVVVTAPATGDPLQLGILALLMSAPAIAAIGVRRFDFAGWYLGGAGLPPLLVWSAFVLEDTANDALRYEDALVVWVVIALVIVIAGLAGIALGNRQPADPLPTPPDQPDPTRVVAVAIAFQRMLRFGLLDLPNTVSIGIGVTVGWTIGIGMLFAGVDPLLSGAVTGVVIAVLATDVYYRAWPRRLARVEAAHAFVGSWEAQRFRETTGTEPPTSPAAARAWLAAHPESDANRWVRGELYAWIGDLDAAYRAIERMPDATAEERFQRDAMRDLVDIAAGHPAPIDGLRDAAPHVGLPGSDERLRAETIVALSESRRRLVSGRDDWMEPMLGAQERIGPRALGILRSNTWKARLRSMAIVAAVIVVPGELMLLAFR